jgi:hypothetical protein
LTKQYKQPEWQEDAISNIEEQVNGGLEDGSPPTVCGCHFMLAACCTARNSAFSSGSRNNSLTEMLIITLLLFIVACHKKLTGDEIDINQ